MTSAARYDSRDSRVTMYQAPALPWPSVRALPERAALDRALAITGRPTPCQLVEPEAWTSDDAEDREIAAMYCVGCLVMNECRAAGRTEHFGVWAGIDRTTKENAMPEVPWAALDGRRRPLPVCCNPIVEFSIDAITTTHAAECPANTDPGSDAGVKARLDTAAVLVSALADLGIRVTQVVETRPGERTVIMPPERRPNQKERTTHE